MAARANTVAESDILWNEVSYMSICVVAKRRVTYCPRIDCNTVVLVVHISTSYDHIRAAADVKSVGVVATFTVTGFVVDRHARDRQSIAAIYANSLNWGILDVEIGDRGRDEIMGVEEFRLRLPAITSLSVPPTCTVRVQIRPACSFDSNSCARDPEQGA